MYTYKLIRLVLATAMLSLVALALATIVSEAGDAQRPPAKSASTVDSADGLADFITLI
jgi:hypothetical protein